MKLVVGLGNPGRKYEDTRHNVGFRVLDALARRCGAVLRRSWLAPARTGRARLDGVELLLVKPETYMNRSGWAVVRVMRRKGCGSQDLIVALDDVELKTGQIRIRKKGGAGGHNGLQSVIDALGTEEFLRVRVGVGPRPAGRDLVEYVLEPFARHERPVISEAVERAAEAAASLVQEGPDRAMNRFNE